MKTEFKAKFLQHVAKKKKEEGFTLIELLVVIIIIGILSAIALPSFLNQANKAKQSEAKQYISSINKGQQAYYVERGRFVPALADISDLGLGIKVATSNYTYNIGTDDSTERAAAWTDQGSASLRGYVGVAFIQPIAGGANTSETIICEGTEAHTFAAFTATACSQATGYTTAL
ncbi:type IV pilin-like G/H family protein [Okeania sp. KiyG1]|uniref:type IV pilin-like G/H family protein n=1 Tax=Okeania sp. KiyG1 TaxID=2720165 RepID=UPI001923A2B3|nr:type IV pilin-like G/H family protein [Okeania sp. KiyG1]GGA40163.1 pili assembly chaperone [Okeania sp. KiyG1]